MADACQHFESIFRANIKLCSSLERAEWLAPKLGVNIAIMSCQKCTGLADIYKNYRAQTVAAETKYDGERLQVHLSNGTAAHIRIFNKSKRDGTEERQHAHEYAAAYSMHKVLIALF